MTAATAYENLTERFRRLSLLGEAAGVLHWDMSVLMPQGGAMQRAEQLSALRLTRHEMISDSAVADWLEEAAEEVAGDTWAEANVREMHRSWVHDTAIDGDLVQALSRACAACEMKWRAARPDNDFASVVPALEEVLRLTRLVGAAKAEALGCSPYEALMDQYEPGARMDRIDALFSDLAAFLPDFLENVLTRQATHPFEMPAGPFAVEKQRVLGEKMMHAVGFDFEAGRLDVSLHPFCGGVPEDTRITTRYEEDDFTQSLMGVLHETGHAMYEKGLPADWRNQPVGTARGMAMHESQSLLIEMQACRSREFLEFAAPEMRTAFGGEGAAWTAENLYRLYTRVTRGLIRVDADEVTYPAHVILRTNLETALIAGDMAVEDIPAAWNDGMEDLLGVCPPDDRDGCLQDIHWYDGAFGYFPTYTMGALAAAQIFDAAKRAVPDIPDALSRGDFAPLMGWLRDNIHGQASIGTTDEILIAATGASLGTDVFKRHLTERYLG